MGETNPSETIGQYRIEACIAEGNLARLCRAVDRTSGQRVMMRLVDQLVCRNELVRASLEALRDPQHPRRARDPHFLQILDAGIHGDAYYVVKEYFESLPLDQFLARENPALQEKLRLARLILECLRAVHGHRIVHGDVKPQNLLVGRDRNGKTQVKIALSDLATSPAHGMISICGELLATPKYLSPEQAKGKPATDGSDLFALGVVFYEMFTGCEPFPADTPLAYLRTNTDAPLLPADKVNPQLPADLARLLARLLAHDLDDRYRHTQSVLDDLDRVESALNGVTPLPVPVGSDSAFAPRAAAHGRPETYWKPIAIGALAAFCILLLAGIVLLGMLLLQRPRAPEENLRSWNPLARVSRQLPPPLSLPASTVATLPATQPSETEQLQKSAMGLHDRVEALVKAGQYDDALAALNQFTADPRNAPLVPSLNEVVASVMLLKGMATATKNPSDALPLFQKIIKEYPATAAAAKAAALAANALVVMAAALDQPGDAAKEVALLEQARKEYPGTEAAARAAVLLPPAQWKLAQSLAATEPDRALEMMKPLLNAKLPDADMANLKRTLGQLLLKRVDRELAAKQYADAARDLRGVRDLAGADPSLRGKLMAKEPEALAGLALQCKEQGKPSDAVAAWKELQTRYPGAYALKEHAAEMAPLVEAAAPVQATPEALAAADPAMLLSMARKSIEAGDSAAALPNLERLLRDFPTAPESAEAAELLAGQRLTEALEMLNSGRKEEAIALMERIVREQKKSRAAAQATALLDRMAAAPKGMAYIPAGPFTMGLSPERLAEVVKRFGIPSFMVKTWFNMQMPARRLDLKGFYMDQCEVTNAEYKAYVDASGAPPPANAAWEGKEVAPGFPQMPVVGVTLEEAASYAAWAGKRLPTEEEWEKAARGVDGRLFPWGDEFDPKNCVTGISGAKGPEPAGLCTGGASPYGLLDMIGNAAEWTRSSFVPYPGAEGTAAAADDTMKVVRGAAWDELSKEFCLVTMRKGVDPAARSDKIGFRCVKDAQ